MILLELFKTFLFIGLFSFGGGYAIIPIIEREVVSQGWMTSQEMIDVIAVAGMSPGPIATNSAVFIGFQIAGFPGAISAVLGMIIPPLVIVLLIASFFYKIHRHHLVKSIFYGLKPIIAGLIIFSSIRFAISNQMMQGISWYTVSLFSIFAVSLFALMKFKVHPLFIIIASGLVGIAFYA